MLVLRRRAGESLLIGDDVEVEILEIHSQWVKIGIKADKQISVLRKELRVVEAQNRFAAEAVDLEKIAQSLENFKTGSS